MTAKQTMLRFDILVKRHPAMTEKEFHEYWTYTHAPLIKVWLQRHGVHRYTQYHTPKRMREQQFGPQEGLTAFDFDGHGEIVVPNEDCLKSMVNDPYFTDVVEKDEAKFLDKESIVRRVGYEEVWVQDGQVVEPDKTT